MITIQNYVRAQSLEQAWQLNQSKRNRIVGGMLWLRLGTNGIGTAIDLCELGLELSDSRFVKNGCTALDGLMAYALSDGSFRHTLAEPGSNQMATEQAFYALAAVRRAENGQSSLYRMTAPDAIMVSVKELMELVRAAMARAMTR